MLAVPFSCVTKTRVPAVDGLFTEVDGVAHLIGAKTPDRESYFFLPTCPAWRAVTGRRRRRTRRGAAVEHRHGLELHHELLCAAASVRRQHDPYEPITIAAVKLEREQMVVLGQCTQGITPDDLEIGMEMELYIDVLNEDDEHEYTVWKWRPRGAAAADDRRRGN